MEYKIQDYLSTLVDALKPIIYINYFDFNYTDKIINEIAENVEIFEYNNGLGEIDFKTKEPFFYEEKDLNSLNKFLLKYRKNGFKKNTFIILKDIHKNLNDYKTISIIKKIAEDNLYKQDYYCTIFIVSNVLNIPKEIKDFITIIDIPLPQKKEIKNIIEDFTRSLKIDISEDIKNDFIISLKGFNKFQIDQILNLSYQNGGMINKDDLTLILKEKEQIIKKSNIFELIDTNENINNIGGLNSLKQYLTKKAKIFKNLDKAKKYGVDIPKGVLITGIKGCGKTLICKTIGNLFDLPLININTSLLFEKNIFNIKEDLKLLQTITPCIIFIDELENLFFEDRKSIFLETFLMWLKDNKNEIFFIANINNINKINIGFLQNNIFDEIFFIDLPNEIERKDIIKVHLDKRKVFNKEIDIYNLAKLTNGFSGSDLERMIKNCIEECFLLDKESISTYDLINAKNNINCTLNILENEINDIKEIIENLNIKIASD